MSLKKSFNAMLGFCFMLLLSSCGHRSGGEAIKYANGNIFDGNGFKKTSFVVKDGKFYWNASNSFDSIIDLQGKYVIPPFGDAHTHNFDDPAKFDSIYRAYINEGTFYVKVLTNHYSKFLDIRDSLNSSGRIDAKFAHGGITSTGGHPHTLYESQALNYSWRAMFDPEKKEEILSSRMKENDAYYIIDTTAELDEKWPIILSKHPDFIKIYILNTKERAGKKERKEIGTYGLSEEVIEAVVKKAKADNIHVTAHVETKEDFELALHYGITDFAHMPGYGGGIGDRETAELELSDSLLQIAGKMNIRLTPTVSFAKYYSNKWDGTKMSLDTALLNKKYDFLRKQLRRFLDYDIDIALGTDQNNSTLTEEVDDLIQINAFSNLEFLTLLVNTPKAIFPNRKIGEIKDGFEASFLVLENDPLKDLKNIKDIELRVKNGVILE